MLVFFGHKLFERAKVNDHMQLRLSWIPAQSGYQNINIIPYKSSSREYK